VKYVKIILGVIAALAVINGCVWILQGVNVLPGSFMTGDIHWAYRGAATAVVGAIVLWLVVRSPGVWRGVVGALGVLFMLMGIIWVLQGINFLPGSFMTGDIRWSYRGAVLAVIGLMLLLTARRKRSRR
jgi:hypothetical protein